MTHCYMVFTLENNTKGLIYIKFSMMYDVLWDVIM